MTYPFAAYRRWGTQALLACLLLLGSIPATFAMAEHDLEGSFRAPPPDARPLGLLVLDERQHHQGRY